MLRDKFELFVNITDTCNQVNRNCDFSYENYTGIYSKRPVPVFKYSDGHKVAGVDDKQRFSSQNDQKSQFNLNLNRMGTFSNLF